MNPKLIIACASLSALLPGTSIAVPTIYSYVGTPYTPFWNGITIPGAYTNSMRLTGSITLKEAIAPDSHISTRGHRPEVLAFSFNDGRVEHTKANAPSFAQFILLTNASGGIEHWNILIRRYIDPWTAVLSTYGNCDPGFWCDDVELSPEDGRRGDRAYTVLKGSWTVTPVPEPSTYALFLAGIAIVAVAARLRSRRLPTC